MQVAVIDGLGGGIGTQIVTQLKDAVGERAEIIALGSNAVATDRMVRAGATRGATGENAIRVSVAQADIVVAPHRRRAPGRDDGGDQRRHRGGGPGVPG